MTGSPSAGRIVASAWIHFSAVACGLLMLNVDRATAQEFSKVLTCKGTFTADGAPSVPAHADLAMRFNSRTVMIQRSNVLPVGELLSYTATALNYSMNYQLPRVGTQVAVVPGWFSNTVLIAYPNLHRLNEVRMSVDRVTGQLEGILLNEEEESLGSFEMACEAIDNDDHPRTKF